jgi:RNA-splicing ligase RtcB
MVSDDPLQDAMQRSVEIRDARWRRIVRIVGKYIEDVSTHDAGTSRHRRPQDEDSFHAVETVNDKAVVFLPWNTIEPEAQQQILNTASMPFVFKHVAVMPDCHYGKGATVGTVLANQGAVIPAAVGVDIGCGMIAVRTPLKRLDIVAPAAVRSGIERRIPMSAGKNNAKVTATAAERIQILEVLAKETRATPDQYDRNWRLALGTLGGGNHFIELAEDGEGAVWLTLHSGSRGVGNKIGTHYIKVAQQLCASMGVRLPDRDLAYLPQDHPAFAAYLRDLNWAQRFALHNRNEMMDRALTEVRRAVYGEHNNSPALELQRSIRITISRRKRSISAVASGSPVKERSKRAEATGR